MEEGKPQVICEFKNLEVAPSLQGPLGIRGKLVQSVRLDKGEGGKVRVFVELAPDKHYDLQQVFFKEENFFVLMINSSSDKWVTSRHRAVCICVFCPSRPLFLWTAACFFSRSGARTPYHYSVSVFIL